MRILLTALLLIGTGPAKAGEMRVGAAAVSITPTAGTPMAGYYSPRAAEGVHDDLFAKAIVLEQGETRAALVALDLITTTRDLVDDARRQVENTTAIRGEAVMLSATHSHTGPLLSSRGPRDEALGGGSEPAQRYRAELPGKIAEAVRLAESRLTPARLFVGHGRESSIAFNRRFHMTDGTVGWNPGKRNPNILKPAGTIDPDVPIVYFESKAGSPLALYVNYAVHLDNIGGATISADMPATLSRLLADFKGPDFVTLFTAGCCGDVNHIDVNWAERQSGFANAARMGTILSAEVLRTWPRLVEVETPSLRYRSSTVSLSLPELQPGDADRARNLADQHRQSQGKTPAFLDAVWAYKVLDVTAREGQPHRVEVQVIALGDQLAWVSLPGEIFVELGLAIKQDSLFPHTIIAELANGSIGYIPSRRAYDQGNYEVVSARCAEGSGERLVEAAVRLLKEARAEHVSRSEKPAGGR